MAIIKKLTAANLESGFANFFKKWRVEKPDAGAGTTKFYYINQKLTCDDQMYLYLSIAGLVGANVTTTLYRATCIDKEADFLDSDRLVPIPGASTVMVAGAAFVATDFNITDFGADQLFMEIEIPAGVSALVWDNICLISKSRR